MTEPLTLQAYVQRLQSSDRALLERIAMALERYPQPCQPRPVLPAFLPQNPQRRTIEPSVFAVPMPGI